MYDLAAALIGVLLGVAVAVGMVFVLAAGLSNFGLDIKHHVEPRSLAISYCLGVVLTLIVVVGSASRVSRLNLVTAIRDLPEPPRSRRRRRSILLGVGGTALGTLMAASGVSGNQGTAFLLGVSIVIISLVPLGRSVGIPERAIKTAAGLTLVVWWLLPFDVVKSIFPDLKFDISVFITSGLMIVLGAAWTVMYNADALLGALMWIGGRIRSVTPVLKMAIAYPLRDRFRTGVTFTMFTLVVFTLVTGATISGAFVKAFDDVDSFGGGFYVRADTAPTNPIPDITAAVARQPALRGEVKLAASQSFLPAKAVQNGTGRHYEDYPVRGLDERFLDNTTFGMAVMARGYKSANQVWQAVKSHRRLAVVDSVIVPRRSNYNTGAVLPDFKITGFFLEDGSFDPVPVTVRDPQTGRHIRLTVIGVLKETAPYAMSGISTSQRSLTAFGRRVQPTVHYFKLVPGANPEVIADRLENAFLANGMKAKSIRELLDEVTGTSRTFNLIIQGFMGLGLLIGVAALGVITARSVVERRQQIGVLRAIGFRRSMIQLALLLESSFLAGSAILIGTALGLMLSFNVISDSASQSSWENLQFAAPWVNLLVIFMGVYLASLLATFAPARAASRVYPAEALRYQ
jgi:putative ABC transport system permease protein